MISVAGNAQSITKLQWILDTATFVYFSYNILFIKGRGVHPYISVHCHRALACSFSGYSKNFQEYRIVRAACQAAIEHHN